MLHDPCCMGSPATLLSVRWDELRKQEHKAKFGCVPPAFNIGETVWNFLNLRTGSDGKPLSNKVVKVEEYNDGWVKCWLLPHDTQQTLEHEGWLQGWHGSRFECLYSILFDSQLEASWSRKLGHRYQEGAPGIYLHAGKNRNKSVSPYMKHVDCVVTASTRGSCLRPSWPGGRMSRKAAVESGSRSQVPSS